MEDKEKLPKKQETERIHPRQKANLLSSLFFCWVTPIFVKGFKNNLTEDDLYGPLKAHESKLLGNKLEQAWLYEVQTHAKPTLWRAIIKVFGKEMVLYGIVFVIMELGVKMGQPLIIGKLMAYYEPDQTEITKNMAFFYASMIPTVALINVLMVHSYVFGLMHLGMRIRVACCSLIYRKALRLSKSALAETTVGQMVNILSNDVNRFDFALIHFHNLWLAPIETFVIMYLLYTTVGLSSIAGIGILLLFIPLQLYLGKLSSVYRMRTALKTDQRVRLMNEIISGIQVIKMYTWELPFANLVEKARKQEIHQIKSASYLRAINFSFMMFLNRTSIYLCVLTYVLTGNELNAAYVYVVTSFYGNLRQALTMFLPQGVTYLAESNVSVQRIQKFLMYDELESPDHKEEVMNGNTNGIGKKLKDYNKNGSMPAINSSANNEIGIHMNDVSVNWIKTSSDMVLQNVSIDAGPNDLIAIVGPVGSGKTTLLHVILKELIPVKGQLEVTGRISYASQEPWLFAGSIKQNILFGEKMEVKKYKEVVRVCALEKDFKLFPYGDRTIVGERGVMLSGGQKARINLARAIYKDADIYLLDDPLSAVDTHVGKQLFENCIREYLKDKCTVLVTHQLQYLRSVNKIYLIDNRTIGASGTYSELQDSRDDYLKLLQSETNQEEEEKKATIERIKSQKSIDASEKEPVEVKEHQNVGKISRGVYLGYARAGGNPLIWVLLGSFFLLAQLGGSGTDYFLTFWVNLQQKKKEESYERNMTDTEQTNNTNSIEEQHTFFTSMNCLYIYTAFIIFVVIITFTRSLSFFKFCMTASRNLHNKMFSRVVYGTMRFFNTNPSGRILNRFSKDMGSIDEILPQTTIDTIQIGLTAFAITLVIGSVNPWILIPTIIVFGLFYCYRIVFLATSRDLKRIEGITRSPVFSHLTASLQGLTTIRAFRAQQVLMNEFDQHQDLHSSAFYLFIGCSRAFGFWLDLNCVVYIGMVTLSFLVIGNESYGGNVGLAITQATTLTGMLQWGMRQWSEMENQMTSVERVVEYTELPLEPTKEKKAPPNWPTSGNITFQDVSMQYSSDDPFVLKHLTFNVKAREKVGIVGRTGAGKSSLISALFRLCSIEGKIIIDNLDSDEISLHELRSKISIIPQEPVLFSGSLRKNLDPFDEYEDDVLWSALEEVELKQQISDLPAGLQNLVSEGGSNFSVGQRQLICLARAVIRSNKILVLDEATANVDPQTDELIQKTIRQKFKDCTVLTIAHRLHTVMDSDKILVMDAGRVAEFGQPHLLLQNEEGIFYSLVQQTGRGMAENLITIARESYEQNPK